MLAKRPVNGSIPLQSFNYATNQDMNYRYITIASPERSSSNIYVVEEPGTWPQDPVSSDICRISDIILSFRSYSIFAERTLDYRLIINKLFV